MRQCKLTLFIIVRRNIFVFNCVKKIRLGVDNIVDLELDKYEKMQTIKKKY
jgi:hypothetical protein